MVSNDLRERPTIKGNRLSGVEVVRFVYKHPMLLQGT